MASISWPWTETSGGNHQPYFSSYTWTPPLASVGEFECLGFFVAEKPEKKKGGGMPDMGGMGGMGGMGDMM